MLSERKWKQFRLENAELLRQQLLEYSAHFDQFVFLDSCDNQVYGKPRFRFLLAAGAYKKLDVHTGSAFSQLKSFLDSQKDWVFGHFAYDLKNEIEALTSQHQDLVGFPDLVFFIPETLILVDDSVSIGAINGDADTILKSISSIEFEHVPVGTNEIELHASIHKDDYINKIELIREHIAAGDVYELNFCQSFIAHNAAISPRHLFYHLSRSAQAPFSAFMRWHDKYLISSSPERFLSKSGKKVISQPIKGTIRRGRDEVEDAGLKQQLMTSEKDRAENVMIVDLVRNDLARSCEPGSIHVDELFGIYSFTNVHQMVSVVSGRLRHHLHPVEAIRNAFPMGSMTGAPKVKAMQLIEQYEKSKRGLYAGSIGYFTPDQDFDFNVVIRTVLFNASTQVVSVSTGGAIVFDSDPEDEWNECLLKIEHIRYLLRINPGTYSSTQ